jgi:O-antigen biosynthesis protein WbqP
MLSKLIALFLLIIFSIPMLIIGISVLLTSKGGMIYRSKRIGIDNKVFLMPKFRTMHIETPEVASHLISDPSLFLSPIGSFLRRFSLDELPQLFSVIRGEMSFIGPRPALFNQDDLIELRTKKGVNKILPGITGWAQINGRNNLTISEKVSLDEYYLENKSFFFDCKIIWMTVLKVILRDGVSH